MINVALLLKLIPPVSHKNPSEVDLGGTDHVPDGDAAVLAAGHHHAVVEPEIKFKFLSI